MLSPGQKKSDPDMPPTLKCRGSMAECREMRSAALRIIPGRIKKALLLTAPGSLTVETAVVLPVFIACMIAVLQLVNVYGSACRIGSILAETGEEMAVCAYTEVYKSEESPLPAALSAGYVSAKIASKAGNTDCIRNRNVLLSSFMEEDDKIDLVVTYQVQSPSGLLRIPGVVFLQRCTIRGWVGRDGSGEADSGESESEDTEVCYVTEHGRVYHTDPDCTHIHLSIREVTPEEAKAARNAYGGKYHVCEKCGGGDGGNVYITSDGNRYHGSLGCSGLKRTVHEVSAQEAASLQPCSKCAGYAGNEGIVLTEDDS